MNKRLTTARFVRNKGLGTMETTDYVNVVSSINLISKLAAFVFKRILINL